MPPKEFRRARLRARLATLLVATLAIFGLSVVSGVSTPAANAAAGTISNASCSSAVGEATTASITTVSGTDCVVTFTSGTNSWTVPLGVTSVSILVVAGGGAGGNRAGGGGGAGGYVYRTGVGTTPGATISLTVGGGGTAGTSGSTTQGNSGSDSVFSLSTEVRAKGGGGGGTGNGNSGTYAGVAGGSSGGSDGYNNAGSSNTPGSSTQGALGYGQGNSGALGTNGNNAVNWSGGGGGGAGGAGGAGTSGSPAVTGLSSSSITNGGAGGAGVSNNITGSAVCYAAGGGGGIEGTSTGSVGAGGTCSGVTSGGAGAKGSGTAGSGVANTGSGGGGSGFNDSISSNGTPGAGSAGVVVVRWVNPILTSVTATGTNAASCNQTGSNLGVSSSDVTVVGLATGYCVVTFSNPAAAYAWTVPTGVTSASVLVVGGGGGGAASQATYQSSGGGGGGGGVYPATSVPVTAGSSISISVGAGGAGGTSSSTQANTVGARGGASAFGTLTAGGGGGGGCNTNAGAGACPQTNTQSGGNGTAAGNGGGATNFWAAYAYGAAGTATSVTIGGTTFSARAGYNGGSYGGTTYTSAAGGGAGGAGTSSAVGPGVSSSITGTSTTYGVGGGAYGVTGWSFGTATGIGTGGSGVYSSTGTSLNGASGTNGVVVVSYPMPAPTITSITPAYGVPAGSTTVTLAGTNFTGATGVTVGGTAATGVTVVSPTSLTFVTPAGTSGAKNVVVTTPGGSATLSAAFTYGASSVSATGTNASYCAQTGNNLGNGTTDVTAVATSNGYCVVTFTNPTVAYQWNVPTGVTSVRTVVVGGGAGGDRGVGSYFWGHGGGGGQVVDTTATVSGGTAVSIGVGAAGTAGIGTATWASTTTVTPTTTGAGNGGSSSFGSTTAAGGQAASLISPSGGTSGSGKVGGVGSGSMSAGGCGNLCGAGGGGGAGAAGSGLNGGAGVFSDITGTSTEYGAGGAGRNNSGFGTAGGGASVGADALANRGGGGSDSGGANGTNGGSGVVIVSYPLPPTVGTASIAGTTQVGSTLTASTTAVASTSTTYQWLSATTAAGTYSNISGATSSTYTLTSNDFNTYLKVVMTITNANGTAAETSTATAVVTAGAPTVTALSPQSGTTAGGTSVTITGTNFLGVTGVKFGTLAAASYTVVSATSITATSPAASASTVDITVTNATGTSATSSADKFSYTVTAATATGTNASACNQAGTNLGNGTTDITAVGTSTGYCVVTFKNPSVAFGWTVPTGVTTVSVLTVGGGGGAGAGTNGTSGPAGGGGGGGVSANTAVTVTPGNTISISVGAGGAGATAIAAPIASQNGGSTSFGSSVTALGGGGGAGYGFAAGTQTGVATGGGGGGNGSAGCTGSTPTGTTYLGATVTGGLNGGYGVWGWGGGGGGAGGAATPGSCSSSNSGTPGVGVSNSITGTPVTYGQGGYSNYSAATTAGVATVPANTGFGGNAAYSGGASNGSGSSGANGVLIVSYGMFVSYTYNANNGTGTSPAGGSVQGGTSFSTAANPYSRDGYTFTGWNTAANGSGTALTANASNTMPASTTALVFYAQWTANSNTVTFNSQGGSAVSSSSWSTGTALTLPAAPTRAGYTFDGWYDSASGGSRVIKNALSFDGVNDRITIPHSTAFNFTNAMTIEAWINTTSTSAQYITTKGDDSFYLQLTAAGAVGVYLNGSPATGWIYSSTTVNDGNWHHVAVTYNGSLVKIIIDGVERASTGWTGTILTGTSSVEVGSRTNNVGASYGSPFSGKMYDLRYWNIARSATDIASTMNTELAGTESGLVAAYLLNQGSPGATNTAMSTATSSKSGSSSGTLLNFALSGTSSNWVSRGTSYTPSNTSAFTLYAQWVALSTDATLSGLALSVGTLSPTFASATTSYTASVSNATTSLTVTPTVNQTNATVQVKIGAGAYASVTSGSASSALTLAAGANTITVLVTAQDGSTTQTYTVTVTRMALPVISSISPSAGPTAGGAMVVLTGTGFTGATAVKFGTTNATTFIVNSDTQTTVTSPAIAASTLDITITTPAGTSITSSADQYVFTPAPTITSLSPKVGPIAGGTSVTLTGTNLSGTSSVTIGGAAATNLVVVSATSITFTTPAGSAGGQSVVVTATGGSVTLANGFSYGPDTYGSSTFIGTSVPWTSGTYFDSYSSQSGVTTIDQGAPTNNMVWQLYYAHQDISIPAGSNHLAVNTTTSGSNSWTWFFSKSSATNTMGSFQTPVQIGTGSVSGYTAGGFNQSNNTVAVTIPANTYFMIGLTGGPYYRSNKTSSDRTATISGSPVVTSINTLFWGSWVSGPTNGVPTALGGLFANEAHANGGSLDYEQYNGVQSVISVYFALGSPTPTITSLSVAAGPLTAGTATVINGTNLLGTTAVSVGGVAATLGTITNTTIALTLPLGTAGAKDVVLSNPNGNVTLTGGYTYVTAPTVTSLASSVTLGLSGVVGGPLSGGTTVTVTGSALTGTSSVTVGGVAATNVTVVSDTSVTFVTPAGSSNLAYNVVLTTAGGSTTKTNGFTYVSAVSCGTSGSFNVGNNEVTNANNCQGSVAVPSGVITIDVCAFANAGGGNCGALAGNALTDVTIPSSVVTISAMSFLNCGITSFTFATGSGLKTIGNSAFYFSGQFAITIPGSVTNIDTAFYKSNVNSVTFATPSSLTSIGASTFRGNPYLTSLVIPSSVTTIGNLAFSGSAMTQITFNGNITSFYSSSVFNSPPLVCIVNPNNYAYINNFAYAAPAPVVVTSASLCGTPPTITSLSPSTGSISGGTAVTLTGTNLAGVNAVWVNGVSATSVVAVSATSVTFVTPANAAGTYAVWVDGANGPGIKASAFVYTNVPTVTSLSTSTGTTAGGTSITITGSNFTGATAVKFGTTAATSFTVVSSTSITAVTPALAAGTVDVTVTTANGTSATSSADQFTFVTAPTIASASITGTAQVGSTLTAVPGTITGSSVTTSYQWQSAATSGGTYSNISLATASTYTAVSADAGKFIKVVITVTNTGGTASQTSSATSAVLLTAPTLSSATISGTAQVGSTLTATPGTTTGTSTTTTYQWQSATLSAGTYTNIASATSSTYTAVAADAGNFIKVVITVTNNGGTAVQTSAATTAVTLASALTPTFGAATLTADGFTVQITNYNASYTWTGAATSSGVVTVSGTGLVAVTGVAPGTSSTATITSTRAGFADGSAQISATSITGSSYSPIFSATTSTSDGFTVRITNFDSTYTWPTPTVSAGSISVGTPVGSIETLTVTGLTPTSSAMITQTVTRTGYNSGSGTVTGSALIGAALVPTFSSVTQTSTGFTVSVTNYNALFTWVTPTTTAGTVTVGTPSGSTRLITVSGLNPGSSATLTVTTSRTSYVGGSASVSGSSNLSSDKTLSSLVISSGTLSPTFSSSTSTYSVTVANNVSSITITPTVNQINASVEAKIGSGTNSLLTSGAASGALSLAIGANTLTITVTAQDLTTGTYVLTVTRSASADATLSALTISSGTLSPTFASATTAYTVSLANSVSAITVTPTANQAYATIQAKVGSGSYSTVYSGTATSSLNLAVGANTITILVTAQDGSTTNTYSVIATRAPPSHGVTYNLGSGTGTLPTQSAIAEGSTFTLAASTGLTYPGYTFNKWNDGTSNYSAGATYTMSTSNVVLTATWTPTSQTVTYLAGTGGSGTAPTQTPVATAATFSTASSTFTRNGYNFAGWYDGTSTYLASATYTMGISNVTLTATWTPQVYTVTYDANGASGSASRTTDSYTYGTSAINLPTVGTMALTGYTFGGWSTSGNTPAISGSYTPSASVTLKAIWTPNVYTVSFSINGATGTTPTSINYTVGTTAISLSNGSGLSYPGYRFDGWATTTGGSSVGTTYTPTSSITLQAIWTAIDYTISYSLNGGTSAQPSSLTKTVGTTFTVEAAPTQDGYVFAGWSYNSNTYSSGSTFTVGTSNVAFTAVWIPLYTVHYVMNGSSTSAPADQLQPRGTSITLEPVPTRSGYTFSGWRDQTSTLHDALTSFTVAADSTLTAVWTAIPYTVTYTLTPAPGTPPSQFTVTIGSVFTLASAPVWAGYNFLGWNDGTTNYGGGSSYLAGTQNIAFVAQWSAINYTVDYDVNGATSSVPASLVKNVAQTFQLPSAPTKTGWIFDNWSDGTSTYLAGATYTMPASNVILTANYHAPAPTIASLSATSGSVLGGTAIDLTGTNFTLATAVTVGGAAATFVINSDTSISIITPAGSNGSANIVLTATGGSATKSGFAYSLLTQSPLALVTTSGIAGTAITLATTGGSGTGSVSFMTITSGCTVVTSAGVTYLNASDPANCVVFATKAADATYAAITTSFTVPFVKIASSVALALPSNAIFASYNFTINLSATTNTPGTVTFSDDGTRIGSCNNVATSSNVATCSWTPAQIKTGKVLTALFTPTNSTDYETSTATALVNVVASSLSGLNPADLYQLGSISALSNGANSQTFSTTDTTLVLTVPANALPSGSTVHLLLDTNGASLQTIIGTGGYLLNSIVAWNAPDGSVPAASVPISLAITNTSIRKGMVIYGILNGVTTELGKASTNGSVTVYLSTDPVIVIAPTKPDAPTSVLASNGQNQSSVVSWLAPSSDGGQPITQYTVTASGAGGQTCTTTNSLSCTVSGLANGTSYTFTVTATNAVGTSDPSSQSPSVTPVGPPTIITPTTGLTATYGHSYTLQIVASGSAQIQSFAVHSGSLPSGLSLNSVSGLITGNPSAAGTYSGISIATTDANLQSSFTSPFTIVVNPESVAATLSISPTTAVSTGTAYTATITPTLTLSGSSTGAITYAISGGTATNCVITGTTTLTLTANTAGTCSFTATQAADSNYAAVTTTPVTFTFTKAIPAPIVITTTSGQVNTPLSIVTSGGSGTGTNTFTTSGTGCSISGSTLTATQLGTCAVTVSNPGDTYYSSESTTATISIGQITLNAPTSMSTSSSSGTSISVTFTGDSNGTTDLTIYLDGTTSTVFRTLHGYVSGTAVTLLTPGTTYYVSLMSIGTGNYANSAATSRQSVTTLAQAATPSVSIAPSSSSLTLGQSISFVATANTTDGGTLSYRWSFGGVTIDSATASTYSFTPSQTSQAGVYMVTVTNSKNGTQTTATATASLSISGALSISTPSTGLSGSVGATITPISAPAGGGAGTLSYAVTTGLSQLTALGLGLDSSTATAQIIGTPVAAGTATIVITVTDANSQAVSTTAFTITIAAASQSIAFTLSASSAASTGTSFEARLTPTLTLAGAGTGAVTYSIIGGTATGCQLLNSSTIETITATSAGTCQIIATKAADANYLATTSSAITFTFTRAAQTPLVITSSRTGTLAAPLTLTTTGGSGSGAITFTGSGANCVLSGSTLSATGSTACNVVATKAADTYYETATSTSVNVSFGQASLNAPVITSVSPNSSTTSLTVTYTADSHGTSVTLNVYAAPTDASPSTSVTNFASGSAVSGLTAGTTYYIGLLSVGNSTYADSSESTRVSGATLVGATAPVIDAQPTASSLNITAGQMETLTVTAHSTDSGSLTYQWNFGGNAIPGATSSQYVFTSTSILQSGNYTVTVTEALNGTLASVVSNNVAVAVAGPIAIATPSAGLSGTIGFAYSLQIVAAGGTSPLTFSVATGAADLATAGLALNAQSGLISGTVTETGTVTLSVTVTDAANSSATTAPFTINLLDDPDAPVPTFSTPVSTNGGFTVIVTNYDVLFAEAAMVSAGTITNSIPNGANWLLTVTGLTPGQSATITVTTSRIGYVSGTATVTGTASNALPPITYTPYLGQGTAASVPVGYTVIPSNLAQVLHATLTVDITTVRSLVTFAPMSSPVPSWQTPFVLTGAIQVVDIYPTGLSGKIQVCLDGTSSDRLWHFINGAWVDITDSHSDTQVCGFTTTFSPFGVGVPVPVVPLPSIFVVKSPVKISLSGNTFTFTAATLEFSYHGAQLQPAVLVDQEINLMADGKVIRNLRLIAPTATITLDTVERGVVYTFQELVSEADATDSFNSHNTTIEYGIALHDRVVRQNLEKQYFVALNKALQVYIKATNALSAERLIKPKKPVSYFDAVTLQIQAQRRVSQAIAAAARQQALRDLQLSDYAELRAAGVSICLP